MKVLAAILVIMLGVAAANPMLNTNGVHHKRLSKDPAKFFQGASMGGRVLNGSEAVPHSRPYEAYLVFKGYYDDWACGGFLISENYVLTAGHCVYQALSGTVLLGAHNVKENESTQVLLASSEFVLHDNFDLSQILFDIGLVKLPQAVTLNSAIQTIALPSKTDAAKSYVGDTVTISGWGVFNGDLMVTSDVLLEVDVKVISLETCLTFFDTVEEYQICTSGDEGKGACSGDSGSPLIYNNVAIGLSSYGESGCVRGYPNAFTSTSYFLDWIQENSDVTSS